MSWKLDITAPNGSKTQIVAEDEDALKAHIDQAMTIARENDPEPTKGTEGQPMKSSK